MRTTVVVTLALLAAGCGGPSGPAAPADDNAGMMISNETVMSDAPGEAGNEAAAVPARK